jgi:hypothetical protein
MLGLCLPAARSADGLTVRLRLGVLERIGLTLGRSEISEDFSPLRPRKRPRSLGFVGGWPNRLGLTNAVNELRVKCVAVMKPVMNQTSYPSH